MEVTRMLCTKRMSQVVNCDGHLYLSGITSSETGIIDQTKNVLAKLEERLEKAGSDKHHLLRVTIYLKDISMFAEMNSVYDAWVDQENLPARACVQAALSSESELIEIVADAIVK